MGKRKKVVKKAMSDYSIFAALPLMTILWYILARKTLLDGFDQETCGPQKIISYHPTLEI